MNLKISGVGAEPKKLAILGACLLIGAYFYFSNSTPGGSPSPSGTAPRTVNPAAPVPLQRVQARPASRPRGQRGGGSNIMEFHPSLKPRKDAELDRASIDPTLKLELLEKLQKVKVEGSGRSLFEYSSAPAAASAKNVPEPGKIIPKKVPYGPPAPPPVVAAVKPPEPQAPPIPLKFYGFIAPVKAGIKRAFFLDGEDIIVAGEGQTVKNRYKIVRIGVNSAVVEDTQFKNKPQTLPLVEEQTG